MTTSLSALTLEIYYRYSPLYDADDVDGKAVGLNALGKRDKADTLVPAQAADKKARRPAKKPAARKAQSDPGNAA